MKWTRDKPTEAGWYWMRRVNGHRYWPVELLRSGKLYIPSTIDVMLFLFTDTEISTSIPKPEDS